MCVCLNLPKIPTIIINVALLLWPNSSNELIFFPHVWNVLGDYLYKTWFSNSTKMSRTEIKQKMHRAEKMSTYPEFFEKSCKLVDKFENEPRMSKYEKQKWESLRMKNTRRVNERETEVIFKVFERNIRKCFKIYFLT